MFTGLISEVGHIAAVAEQDGVRRITVAAPRTARQLRRGESVAVSGVCLTAIAVARGRSFSAHLAAETVARSSLGQLAPGARVNLELAARRGQRLGGHFVQGHADGVARLTALYPASARLQRKSKSGKTDFWLRLRLPAELARYVVEKGSIAVEGISLTVAAIAGDVVTAAIVPHTYAATNLRGLAPGAALNIEVDVLAKYAEKLAAGRPRGRLTRERLRAEGF